VVQRPVETPGGRGRSKLRDAGGWFFSIFPAVIEDFASSPNRVQNEKSAAIAGAKVNRLIPVASIRTRAMNPESTSRIMNLQTERPRFPAPEQEPMLREVLQAAMTVAGSDMGLLSLCDPQRAGLRTAVSEGFGPEFLQVSEFIPPGTGACGTCYQQRRRVIIADVEQDPLFVRYRETAQLGGFRAVCSVPLMIFSGRIMGVLSVYFREPHRPLDRELQLIELYARQAADSLENTRLQGEIIETRAAAERTVQAKDNFITALSHELRAPLNPVLLVASERAGNPELPDQLRVDFNNIARNVKLEARLIEDLLDLTGITPGKRVFEARALDAHDILQNALVTAQPQLERKHIALTLGLRAKRYTVMGDAARLEQVFWNVIDNAVKFSGEKEMIAIGTRTNAAKERLTVTIVDTGTGMTEAELGSAFNAFAQGHHSGGGGPTRRGGMGIGLARSRMLVELHGGSIRAFSAGRGQGSTVVIELPLVALEGKTGGSSSGFSKRVNPSAVVRTEPAGHPCRVLLVEDHEPTRVELTKLLARRRYVVVSAGSVAEAMALADQKEFDLVIADIGLPDADGWELMTTLRERHGLKGIAVTGYGTDLDIAHSKVAGFVAHLIKPVTAQSVEDALAAAAAR